MHASEATSSCFSSDAVFQFTPVFIQGHLLSRTLIIALTVARWSGSGGFVSTCFMIFISIPRGLCSIVHPNLFLSNCSKPTNYCYLIAQLHQMLMDWGDLATHQTEPAPILLAACFLFQGAFGSFRSARSAPRFRWPMHWGVSFHFRTEFSLRFAALIARPAFLAVVCYLFSFFGYFPCTGSLAKFSFQIVQLSGIIPTPNLSATGFHSLCSCSPPSSTAGVPVPAQLPAKKLLWLFFQDPQLLKGRKWFQLQGNNRLTLLGGFAIHCVRQDQFQHLFQLPG